jgi:hypothetical protein
VSDAYSLQSRTDMLGAILGAVGSIAGGLLGSGASKSAANQQAQSDAMAIAEQRRQFDALQKLLTPYSQAGASSLSSLMALSGAGGGGFSPSAYLMQNPDVAAEAQRAVSAGAFRTPEEYAQFHYGQYGQGEGRAAPTGFDAQNQAISQLEQSPMFQSLARQGEQGILQNASATGGLRGGNVQGALAQFRPAMLNQQIQQQMQNLSGIASLGQNAAAGVGSAGMQMGQNIGGIMQNTGQARAYGTLGSANALGGALNSLGGIAGSVFGGMAPKMPNVNQIMAGANASLGAGTPGMVTF